MEKRTLSIKLILPFFRSYLPNHKVYAKPPIWENLTTLQETYLFWVFFRVLGTKTIDNMKVTLYGNPKQNYWKRVFSVFYVENAKTDANQPKWSYRITLPKNKCFWVVFFLLPIKKLKYMQRSLYLGNERTLREMCIMNVFKFLKYQNVKTDANQPISRNRKTLPKRYFLSVFERVRQ